MSIEWFVVVAARDQTQERGEVRTLVDARVVCVARDFRPKQTRAEDRRRCCARSRLGHTTVRRGFGHRCAASGDARDFQARKRESD